MDAEGRPDQRAPASRGTTGSAGTTGSGGSGACVKGQTHGKDVAILGESFIALSTIPTELETLAKAQGSLASSEQYVNNAVSGTTIAGANGNVDQFNKAIASSGTIKYVIMDGGGNDCLQANNPTQALTGADKLFTLMTSKNTEKVLYFFYPDPIGSQFRESQDVPRYVATDDESKVRRSDGAQVLLAGSASDLERTQRIHE